MSVEKMFEEIVEFTKEDFESTNPTFQVYITVGAAYRYANNTINSTLYIPILDSLYGPSNHTVILAFDNEFANEAAMEFTCTNLTNYFREKLNIPIGIDFDNDYNYKTKVRRAHVMLSDTDEHPKIKKWLNTSQILIYFLPMGLPTDYFRDIPNPGQKKPDEWMRIQHIQNTYSYMYEYANTCSPKQPIYIELGKFINQATSVVVFNDAWFHINGQFYSNRYFEDMCELLYIVYASGKPVRLISKIGLPIEHTTPKSVYDYKVEYDEHILTKQSKFYSKKGGRKSRRRAYTRRVTLRKPTLRR